MAAEDDKKKSKGSIKVSCPSGGPRRRAGYTFNAEPTEIPLDDLDKKQFEALDADPQLKVQRAA